MLENPYTAQAPKAWLAPLVSTLVTLPVAVFSFGIVGLSAMACDSCSDAELKRFDPSYNTGFIAFLIGLTISLALLIASWALPPQRHRATVSLLAPITPVLAYLLFRGLVDWP
ncbi:MULTISPECIES: hypothetical protein [unclassified Streptomyces]|uniref:hypothetical protein n=1 Tax=unclassified Streptomyces TaxID=2593676 RepID=UPI002E20695F|nr:hypothetical protein OG217_37610 [Streptomyces sp. NBC_01023]